MSERIIGHRLFVGGVTCPIYADAQGQYIIERDERIDGRFLVPVEDLADTPLIVEAKG